MLCGSGSFIFELSEDEKEWTFKATHRSGENSAIASHDGKIYATGGKFKKLEISYLVLIKCIISSASQLNLHHSLIYAKTKIKLVRNFIHNITSNFKRNEHNDDLVNLA